ncbi:hypothetical protein B9Z55_009217 [Caenorhabditis nigoni]|uniref:Uncharacterized protein n=1 Tax=Caenorhabditis nigoni TaxID=1611254 RepID=A0A2G5URJ5_9PELO|nr:hypothetical protein B9Z55_009217 [Caenorhabditis nigoni]
MKSTLPICSPLTRFLWILERGLVSKRLVLVVLHQKWMTVSDYIYIRYGFVCSTIPKIAYFVDIDDPQDEIDTSNLFPIDTLSMDS